MKQVSKGLLISAGIILLFSASPFAFRHEPDNFRGIRWGTSIKDLPEMVLRDTKGGSTKFYIRKNDEMEIGQSQLKNIFYLFYKDQFCGVTLIAAGYHRYENLKKYMVQTHGDDYQLDSGKGVYRWRGKTLPVLISLFYDQAYKEGVASYSYEPIGKEVSREEVSKLLLMYLFMNPKCAWGK